MSAATIAALLEAWRAAERRWEHMIPDDPGYVGARNAVIPAWLAYQEATGGIAADELVLVADGDMRYVGANRAAEEVLGYPTGGIVGRSIADLTAEPAVPLTKPLWDAFVANGRLDGEYTLRTATGEPVEVAFMARAHFPVAGLHLSRLRGTPHDPEGSASA